MRNSNCNLCGLCNGVNTVCLWGEGPTPCDVMIIGRDPGAQEDLEGRPFVGNSGRLLNELLQAAGVNRENVYISNVCKCLEGTSRVRLAEGKSKQIRDIVRDKDPGPILSYNEKTGQIESKEIIRWYASPLDGRQTYKISAENVKGCTNGQVGVRVTEDHKILTRKRGWVQAKDLLPGVDEIIVDKAFSSEARQIIIGTLLGDGSMTLKGNPAVVFTHTGKVKDYVVAKTRALNGNLSEFFKIKKYTAIRGYIPPRRDLYEIRKEFYKKGKKVLPKTLLNELGDLGLAIWIMDDGYVNLSSYNNDIKWREKGKSKRSLRLELCTNNFTKTEVIYIKNWFVQNGLACTIDRKGAKGHPRGYVIRFYKDATKTLLKRVAKYFPPSMRYKLPPDIESTYPYIEEFFHPTPDTVTWSRVKVREIKPESKTVFCIDVKDNHNFLTLGGIVRNCRPPGNRPHTPKERSACRVYLDQEIAVVQPKVIITLGGDALEAITGQTQMMKLAGQVINFKNENTGFECRVFAGVHPSYILRNVGYKERALKHFETFGKILRGEAPERSPVKYVTVQTIEQFRKFMAKMREQKVITFDTETTGFNFLNDRILCYSFSWKENTAVVLPLLGYKEATIWTETELIEINRALKEIYADPDITWIAQNISFDAKFLKTAGIEIAGPIEDTMQLQTLCDENAIDLKGLKAMAALYTDMGNYDEELDNCKTALKIEKRKKLQEAQKGIKNRIKDLKKMLKKADDTTTIEINQDIVALEGELDDLSKVSKDITYADIPTDILWRYAAMDADATIRVFGVLTKKLRVEANTYAFPHHRRQPTKMVRYYKRLVMRLRKVLDDMEYRGAKIDKNYLHKLDVKYSKRLIELEKSLLETDAVAETCKKLLKKSQKKAEERYKKLKTVIDFKAGVTDKKPKFTQKEYGIHYGKPVSFNMNSHDHLRILLFDVLGLVHPFPEKTGAAGLSTDKEVLEALEDLHPCVTALQENRKLSKLHTTYVLGQIKRADAHDRVHTNFNQHIAVTGRLSSSDPNLQNIPRANKDIKKAFIPTYGDWCIVQMDYAQAEFRMWAELANDVDMINDIKSGLDIHRATAAQFWGIPEDQVTKEQRSAAKFVVFGLMYGRGAESVAKQVKITTEEAEAIIEQFFAKYPVARKWLETTKRFVERRGFSPGYFGRVRRLPYACMKHADRQKWGEAQRQSVNAPIQGGAADLTGIAMIKIYSELKAHPEWDAHLILTVHDSIILEMPKNSLVPVIKMCHQKMVENVDAMNTPMAADIEVGKNWGDLMEISVDNITEDIDKYLEGTPKEVFDGKEKAI